MTGQNINLQDVSLCFCAAAGQGLQTAEDILGRLLSKAGFYVFTTREYMSRVRGGSNSTRIRVSSTPVRAFADRIDYLFLLAGGLHSHIMSQITSQTKIIGDVSSVTRDAVKFQQRQATIIEIPITATAKELGDSIYEATVLAGVAAGLFGIGAESADALLERRFQDLETAARNMAAFHSGYALGSKLSEGTLVRRYPRADKKEVLMDGNTALSLGTAAAGCNFVAAYPMSPGTALFTFYANNAERLGAVVEQAEDEIGAINMCLGASYAGAQTLCTTSGGGFALMGEGLSLAGISETPVVIHLAQRPGPATGMATRMEQADLNLALYAGHGEFPRAIYAPATVESAFTLGAQAFATAAKFQTPVILLTDQYLLDSAYDVVPPRPEAVPLPENPVITDDGYRRYAFPTQGETTSPRGVPGYGAGLVGFDSHEHTEEAHITEDFGLRTRMADKRMKKLEAMRQEALAPTLFGDPLYQTLIVCWGSLQELLLEALLAARTQARFSTAGVALLSCQQLYPLSTQMKKFLEQARRLIFVENNSTGQFARLVHSETGCAPTDTILKYSGSPFSVEELATRLENLFTPKANTDAVPDLLPFPVLPRVPAPATPSRLLVVPLLSAEDNDGKGGDRQ
jgi:2-oxoglutarate ferredoxin oxidoreductase subunit alpha